MKILEDGTYVFETPVEEAEAMPAEVEAAALPWEVQACAFFVETGNMAATARRFNTSVYHIKAMMAKMWWQDHEAALRQQHKLKSEAGFTRIVEKGLALLEDRLDNGEVIKVKIDPKTGERIEVRAPMKSLDIAKITDMAFMKRQLVRNDPTAIAGSTETLSVLARKLQALGAKDPALLNGPVAPPPDLAPFEGRTLLEDGAEDGE